MAEYTLPHVVHLAQLLGFVARRNESLHASIATNFNDNPEESVFELIARLDQYIRCSESCYAIALVFVDRLTETNKDISLTRRTLKRLFTTSLLVANQFYDDKSECALQFARVASIPGPTMAALKTEFLLRLNYRLVVSDSDVKGYADQLKGRFSSENFSTQGMWTGLCTATIPAQMPTMIPSTQPEPKAALALTTSTTTTVSRQPVTLSKSGSKVMPSVSSRRNSKLGHFRRSFSFLPRYHKAAPHMLENDNLIDMVSNLAHIS